jgi:hypothetical protein
MQQSLAVPNINPINPVHAGQRPALVWHIANPEGITTPESMAKVNR